MHISMFNDQLSVAEWSSAVTLEVDINILVFFTFANFKLVYEMTPIR